MLAGTSRHNLRSHSTRFRVSSLPIPPTCGFSLFPTFWHPAVFVIVFVLCCFSNKMAAFILTPSFPLPVTTKRYRTWNHRPDGIGIITPSCRFGEYEQKKHLKNKKALEREFAPLGRDSIVDQHMAMLQHRIDIVVVRERNWNIIRSVFKSIQDLTHIPMLDKKSNMPMMHAWITVTVISWLPVLMYCKMIAAADIQPPI